ncbi:MAG: SDR family oxidoreductase [Chloroflexi bacterium]|nr:SDR family oxidoreductase [Chloroflexota bacterium]
MSPAILVTGATGNVGREVVRALRVAGAPVRAASTNVERARNLLGDDVEVVPFRFGVPGSYAAALSGVDRLFLVRPPALSDARVINALVDAAVASGLRQLVFLSLQGVERNPVVPHYRIERHVRTSGIPYVFLRAGFFMQNLSTTHAADIRERGEVFVPAGNGRTGFVDVRDIAAIAALVLTMPGHEDQAYELTGPEALSYGQVAAILSGVLHRRITYADPSPVSFWRRMRARGQPSAAVLVMLGLYTACRLGLAAHLTPTVARLLGREPTTFEQFASDMAGVWQPAQ